MVECFEVLVVERAITREWGDEKMRFWVPALHQSMQRANTGRFLHPQFPFSHKMRVFGVLFCFSSVAVADE